MSGKDSAAGVGLGILMGVVIGLAVGMLCAPRPGEETREIIKEKAEVFKHRATDAINQGRERAAEVIHRGEERLAGRRETAS